MRRRLTNPLFLGGVTVALILGAVYFAYNATRSVPLVPTYRLDVEVPNAANLVRGNDVRVGGARVGAVDSIKAVRKADGRSVAVLGLKLDGGLDRLPRDSTVIVRPRSALGLKYVEITPGKSNQVLESESRLAVSSARPAPVELDEVLNMFDEKTQLASRAGIRAWGDGLAGRGSSINQAIESSKTLLPNLQSVLHSLRDPNTRLPRFFSELAKAASMVAPVAGQQGEMFVNLDRTFSALSAVAPALQSSITEAPPAMDASVKSLPQIRPFLTNSQALMRELRPGAKALHASARDLADTVTDGTPTLRRAVDLNKRLKPLFSTLQTFSEDPLVPLGLRSLTAAFSSLDPTLAYATPAQTQCNYVTLLLRNAASLLAEGDSHGTWQRFIIIAAPTGPNSESGPASAPADGPGTDNHLHLNPYPYTAAPGQPFRCEAGNESFVSGRTVVGNTSGSTASKTQGTP